jgi:hypothetical protein
MRVEKVPDPKIYLQIQEGQLRESGFAALRVDDSAPRWGLYLASTRTTIHFNFLSAAHHLSGRARFVHCTVPLLDRPGLLK